MIIWVPWDRYYLVSVGSLAQIENISPRSITTHSISLEMKDNVVLVSFMNLSVTCSCPNESSSYWNSQRTLEPSAATWPQRRCYICSWRCRCQWQKPTCITESNNRMDCNVVSIPGWQGFEGYQSRQLADGKWHQSNKSVFSASSMWNVVPWIHPYRWL